MMTRNLPDKDFHFGYLSWDTKYFGILSAKLELTGEVDQENQVAVFEFVEKYDFITIVNHKNRAYNNQWIGRCTSAFLTDINIQLTKRVLTHSLDQGVIVNNNMPRNNRIIEIAKESFEYSRFFNDPFLPQEQARNIYVHWTDCAFNKEDRYFVTCVRGGTIAGYLIFSIEESVGVIEIIAVDRAYQGQGVGRSLIASLDSLLGSLGIENVRVGTQIENSAAISFYASLGFRYDNCKSIYHWWHRYDGGK